MFLFAYSFFVYLLDYLENEHASLLSDILSVSGVLHISIPLRFEQTGKTFIICIM